MLGRKKKNQFAKGGHTLFDHALVVDGSVRFAGTLDIEGTVNGDIVAEEGADALVRIRDKGRVNGEIRAPKVIINGQVNGDVFADQHLELAAKAEVNGNVHYQVIEMVKGAHVNGGLVHITDADPAKATPAKIDSNTKVAELKVSSDSGVAKESKSQ